VEDALGKTEREKKGGTMTRRVNIKKVLEIVVWGKNPNAPLMVKKLLRNSRQIGVIEEDKLTRCQENG